MRTSLRCSARPRLACESQPLSIEWRQQQQREEEDREERQQRQQQQQQRRRLHHRSRLRADKGARSPAARPARAAHGRCSAAALPLLEPGERRASPSPPSSSSRPRGAAAPAMTATTRTTRAAPRIPTTLTTLTSLTSLATLTLLTLLLVVAEQGLAAARPAVVARGGWAQRELTRPSRLLFRVEDAQRESAAPGGHLLSTVLRGAATDSKQQQQHAQHAALASFLVPAFGSSFTLDLQLNHDLLALGYRERHFDEDGKPVEKQGGELCHYHGKLRGISDSFVAVSTCHGLHGMFHDGNHTYLIEPAGLADAQEAQPHIVYRGSDQDVQAFLPELGQTGGLNMSAGGLGLLNSAKVRVRREAEVEMKYVELTIVNDHIMFKKHRQILGLTNNYAKSIVNMVDAIYKEQLNTRVVLVSMETWTDENRITVSTDPLQTLRAFMKYRRQSPRTDGDTAHLLSGLMFESSHSGVAYFGGVCSLQRGGGVNEYGNVGAMVVTLAQGIGQNLGMLWHNSKAAARGGGCQCTDIWYGCIMEVTGQMLPMRFSQCSIDEYQEFLQAGGGACLFNKPTQLFEQPECGNGFVELGEECDCGSPTECSEGWDKCCKKCTFTHGAICSSGLCCAPNSCQFITRGEECRHAVGECDLPETCPGDSVQCPPNVHKQDGYSCNKDGRCYIGQCKTREKQCKYIWGDKGMSSERQCYDKLNIEGTEKGNCGRKEDSWLQCSKHDVLCGFLLCTNVSREPQLGELQGDSVKVSIRHNGHLLECSGGHIMLADGSDLGYVEDGTPCGPDVICLDHKCQPLQALNLSGCPSVIQGTACSGHGVCSNEARCVCERHWVGNDCSIYSPIPEVVPTKGSEGPSRGPSAANIIIGSIAGAILVGAVVLGGTGWGFKNIRKRRQKKSGDVDSVYSGVPPGVSSNFSPTNSRKRSNGISHSWSERIPEEKQTPDVCENGRPRSNSWQGSVSICRKKGKSKFRPRSNSTEYLNPWFKREYNVAKWIEDVNKNTQPQYIRTLSPTKSPSSSTGSLASRREPYPLPPLPDELLHPPEKPLSPRLYETSI
uniref:Disintegrin and metalloproteinase domain-containing protein 22 isoform X1 n=1 Tax=Petromyzon marinus TaxID=7757 RepID=A0AAJ7SWI0_PETMA|nr:disintegrin and metalloproteinase domain-containing protein 22 isoform X1 [Petromyzon marinus]